MFADGHWRNVEPAKASRQRIAFDEHGAHLLLFGNCEGLEDVHAGCKRKRYQFDSERVTRLKGRPIAEGGSVAT